METKQNLTGLQSVFAKAKRGETLTIGFIGGSITQGCLASKQEYTYAYRVYQWFVEQFPQSVFHYVNAGIGGTTSHFGAARIREDLLRYEPDLVFLDFTVNDEADAFFEETYEGVIRQILLAENKPALLAVYHIYYENGMNAERVHAKLIRHYHLPAVSMRPLYQKLLDGTMEMEEITTDGLHPNDLGHELVAQCIIEKLEAVMTNDAGDRNYVIEENRKEAEAQLPAPITENAYEHAKRYDNKSYTPVCSGFEKDLRIPGGVSDCFAYGWTSKKEGAQITFSVEASELAIQYRRSLKRAPKAKVVLDGQEEAAVYLDGTFDETWGDQLALFPVLVHGEKRMHTLTVTLYDCDGSREDFMLVSLICA